MATKNTAAPAARLEVPQAKASNFVDLNKAHSEKSPHERLETRLAGIGAAITICNMVHYDDNGVPSPGLMCEFLAFLEMATEDARRDAEVAHLDYFSASQAGRA